MSKTYIAVAGDSFSSISRSETGSERNAQLIRQANPHATTPIRAGTSITIPGGESKKGFRPFGLDVKIDGVSVTPYDTFTLSTAVDGFRRMAFDMPNEPETRKIARMLEPIAVDAGYNGTPVFSGYMESPVPSHSDNKKTLSITANSWPNLLMSPPTSSMFPFEMEKAKLDLIARNMIDPFGIEQIFQADPGPVFPKVSMKQSGDILEFLSRLCKQRAMVIRDDEFGTVVFDNGTVIGAPVIRIDDDTRPDADITVSINPDEWNSDVTCILKSKNGRQKKKKVWRNPFYVGALRPYEFEISDSDEGEIETALNSAVARMFASVFSVNITIPGWLDKNGEFVKCGTSVEVRSPSNYIEKYTEMLISASTAHGSGDQKITTLTCVLPGVYAGQIPEEIPWKSA